MELTPECRRCLLAIFNTAGMMKLSQDYPVLTEFCDDSSTLSKPDVFNQCHNAGWLASTYEGNLDCGYVRLTEAGRDILAISEA